MSATPLIVMIGFGTDISTSYYNTNSLADSAVTAVKTAFGGNYSTSEVNTGFTWIDGKTIYKKTVTGTLPNSTAGTTNIAHGITGLDTLVHMHGVAIAGTVMAPLSFYANANYWRYFSVNGANVSIEQGATIAGGAVRATLYYTKT